MCCRWRWGIITDHSLWFLSMRKWPGSSRALQSPKIITRPLHTWRKSTSLCMLTPTSDNHRTTTTPVPDSSPSEPDVTSTIELMVQQTYRKWHQLYYRDMKTRGDFSSRKWDRSQFGGTKGTETNTKEPNGTFLTAKKKAILLIFERSSIVHENICFGACHLTITFYEEKDIQRKKNKTLQATDFSLNLSTDIFTYLKKQNKNKKRKKKKQP